MTTARISGLARWRALLGLLWQSGGWRVAAFAVLVLAAGLLPTGVILATGQLVRFVPAAVEHGLGSAAGEPALLALAALLSGLALLGLCSNGVMQMSRVLDARYGLEVHHTVAMATLGSPGLAPLEDPAFADELHAIQEADRRGVLRLAAWSLSNVAIARIRGIGAFVVLLGFQWWAPLLLAAAWYLTNRVYLQATENGVTVEMSDGAVRMRRAEYLRSLAVEAPAAKEVRVFGLGGLLVGRYGDAWMEALGVMWRSRRANRGLTSTAAVALAVSHTTVLGALGAAAIGGEVGAAALLVFVQAALATSDLGMLSDPQWYLAQCRELAGRVAALRQRVPAVPPPAEPAGAAVARAGKVAVRLEGVRFTYPHRERPTLDGLTLEIPAGQSLAIVGENGVGKTTLIKLLCGLYEPDAGRITLDGDAPLQARGRIAAIFQDFIRYKLPLRENVGFGRLALMHDEGALNGALGDAGGAELLAGMAQGWDTVLSREFDGGTELSGGQWQRVALARALAAVRGGAGLLILDEPTASLDVRAETDLFNRFLDLTRDVTTILVSHRLSSVRHADRIVVVDGGRVVEDGTHDTLMRDGGRYARMFSLQAERFAAAELEMEATSEEVVDA